MTPQITLKFALPEAAQAAFMRHPQLRRAESRRTEALVGIYYDTRRLELSKAGIHLRLRRHGNAWLQTVSQTAPKSTDAEQRQEWEIPYLNHFDFATVDAEPTRRILGKKRIVDGLSALFETSFRRVTWVLKPASASRIAVTLDRGWIAANGRRQPISEVKLELAAGAPNELYALAFDFAARLPLVPELTSKAQRGYRLAAGTAAAPVRATAVAMDADAPPLDAFRAIALNCLHHLHGNHGGAIIGADPEYVHQMRVGTRRLRAALRMFAPVLPRHVTEELVPPLRELMAVLGRTRDLDVLLEEIVGPVAAALSDDPRISAMSGLLTDRLYGARGATADYLASPPYGRLMLLAGRELHVAPQRTAEGTDEPEATLLGFAQQRLRKLQKRTTHLAELARVDDPTSLHQLRIAIKRLRYGIEFFAPLLPKHSLAATAKRLAALQENLGQLNDLANAGAVLMAAAGNDSNLREAVALIGGWHGKRHAELLAAVPAHLVAVRRLRLPKLK